MTRPDTLGKYELISKLATGGMAEVYLARERGLAGMERFVVIKRILPHLAQHKSFVDMFLREGRLIARLNHPNIVQIYELGADADQQYFLALEYIPGVTLRELQVLANKAGKSLPEEVVLAIGIQTASGLAAAHNLKDTEERALGLVHRDVTPHNLMCMGSGLVKLLDFGIAKATQGQTEATYSGDLKGKFSYMSPEQALQKPLDARSDIFSLGIVLWESLTGRRLFKRSSQLEMLQAISTGDAPTPDMWRSGLHERTVHAIMKALSVEPGDRYQDALALKRALQEAADAIQMPASQDCVETFITQVAQHRLDERAHAVKAASELGDMGEVNKHRLLHETSSGVFEQDDDLPTVVERPSAKTHPTQTDAFGARAYEPSDAPKEEAPPEPVDTSRGTRRMIGTAFGVVILCMALGFGVMRSIGPSYDDPPITLAWAPIVDPVVLKEEMQPLHARLSKELGREVRFEVAESYDDLAAKLTRGDVEYGMFPPLLYVRTSEDDAQLEALAIKEFDGSMSSDGLLLVTNTIKAGDLAALKGKTFCLTDKGSTTGNFLPRAYLREQGLDPDEVMGSVVWSGDHLQLLRDLSAGKCDVAATHSGAVITADKLGVSVSKLRTFAITGHVPQDVMCAGKKASREDRAKMKEALLRIDPQAMFNREYLGETQRITGFVPAEEKYYQQLRDALNEEVAKK